MADDKVFTLITGGSRGIGYALARECARRKMNLLLVAMHEDGLVNASEKIRSDFDVEIKHLAIDLNGSDAPQKVREWCRNKGYRVNILVNNAGAAGTRLFSGTDPAYTDYRILLNVRALALLSQYFIDELGSHEHGYILNIGSLSAYYPIAFKTIYSATKSFVHTFSLALAEELRDSNITVTVVHPNGVRTNPDTFGRIDTHSGWVQRKLILDRSEVARMAMDAMFRRQHVLVPGRMNRFVLGLSRWLPRSARIRRAASIFRKELLE